MDPETEASLFEWAAKLSVFQDNHIQPTAEHFKDGIMLGKILKTIIDPEYFKELNYSTENSTPLIKIVEKMKRYLATKVGHQIPNHLLPNTTKINFSDDTREISRLLQLLLVCAVQCPEKHNFVTYIMQLGTNSKFHIMQCIKEMEIEEEPEESLPTSNSINDYMKYRETIEELSQKNYELNIKLSQLEEEKAVLTAENEKLHSKKERISEDTVQITSKQDEEYKKEVEKFRDEHYKLEALIDDYKFKQQELEKQLNDAHSRLASSAAAVEELKHLKDEIDTLREAAAKVSQLELTIQQLRNKLEATQYLRNDMKQFEQKNEELNKMNVQLEDELRKMSNFKSQIDGVKKELADTQQRLSQEKQRAMKAEFDCRTYREKFESLQEANRGLQEQKSRLSEQLEELRINEGEGDPNMARFSASAPVDSIELLPPVFREKLRRLELENKNLQDRIQAQVELGSDEASKILVEQLRKRETELDEALLTKEQENIELKNYFEDQLRELKSQLATKDEELKKKEIQYNKCMAKAKKVINTLEPTAAASSDMSKPDPELEKARAIREVEEKLLATAFYNYGLTLHRNGVEARNQTLLNRQRNAARLGRKSEL